MDPDGKETEDVQPIGEEVVKRINNEIKNTTNKVAEVVKGAINDAKQLLLTDAPELLHNGAQAVTEAGLVIGVSASTVGQPEAGVAVLGGAQKISTGLDAAATALTLMNYMSTPTDQNWNNFTTLGTNTVINALGGNMVNEISIKSGQILKEASQMIITNPYLLPFTR